MFQKSIKLWYILIFEFLKTISINNKQNKKTLFQRLNLIIIYKEKKIKPRYHSEQLASLRFLMLQLLSDFWSSDHFDIIFPKNEEKNAAQINDCLSELVSGGRWEGRYRRRWDISCFCNMQ